MNILFLVHYHELYGSIRSLLDLVTGLAPYGVIPHLILPSKGGLSEVLDQQGTKYAVLKAERWVSEKPVSIKEKINLLHKLPQTSDQVGSYINQWAIDLVYTNTLVSPAGLLAARQNHLPHIWHIREFGDLDFDLKFIYPKNVSKAFMRRSNAIICNSQSVRKHVFQSWTSEKLNVIANGVASKGRFDEVRNRAKHYTQNDAYTYLFIGSISPKKGTVVAIKAFAELITKGINAKLLIAGSGKEIYVNQCRDLANSLNVSAFVQFTGFCPDPYEAYFNSDCLLMCSEYEAFGRVTAEAMSACLPVIGRNSGGTPEVILDGETGLIYNTFHELVDAMQKLAQNPALGQKMGLAGWERARDLFNIEDYAANVYKVIQSVTEKR